MGDFIANRGDCSIGSCGARRFFMPKYLLCRPEAGLNDMLRQLSICADYCLRHGRVLVIDTQSTYVFASPFRDYFSLVVKGLAVRMDATEFLDFAEANNLSVHPPSIRLRYGSDRPVYVHETNRICLNGVPLTFDFKREYAEDILLHHQSGGGPPSDRLLKGMRLSPWLAGLFRERWSVLPKPYVGIHIRDTDKKSSDAGVLPVIQRCPRAVFLATDSAAAQQRARQLRSSGLFMSAIPDYGGLPIHHQPGTHEEKRRGNTTALTDLLILALAETVHVSTTGSGYSTLALRLNRKPSWVLRWFAGAGRGFRFRLWLHVFRSRVQGLLDGGKRWVR